MPSHGPSLQGCLFKSYTWVWVSCPRAKGRHREGKFISTPQWLESKKHCFSLQSWWYWLWLSKKGCLVPRSFDIHSSQNSYFLPELIKGPFFQNMRESPCNFKNYFSFGKHSGTLAEEETDIREDWRLSATEYLCGHWGRQALPETAFSFSLSLSPAGR